MTVADETIRTDVKTRCTYSRQDSCYFVKRNGHLCNLEIVHYIVRKFHNDIKCIAIANLVDTVDVGSFT